MENIIKIGIVDDDSSKVTQIMTYLMYGMKEASQEKIEKYTGIKFEVVEVNVSTDITDIIEEIAEQKLDVMIIDYNLSSYATVPYTGVALAKLIQDKYMDFPLFILTSYEDELYEQEIFDAYQIFDFGRYLSEINERIELHYKIIEQVSKYHKQIAEWKKEIEQLLPLKGTSAEIDDKILELDTKIEKSIDGHSAIPKTVKKSLEVNKLDEILNKIDTLIKEG